MDSPCLPTDVLSEIISRTCLKTVGKFRILSRACNSVTYEWNFSKNLTEKTNTVSGFFVQSFAFRRYSTSFISPNQPSAGDISLKFLPSKEMHIVAAAKQGLLLCENRNPKRHRIPEFYVCKPTTRERQHIPNPKTRFFTEAMGMVVLRSDPLQYKIVRFSEPKDRVKVYKSQLYNTLHCEVFDSATWKWRKCEDDVRLPYSEGLVGRKVPAVSAGCVLYWLISNRQVLAFHACGDREEEGEESGEYWKIFDLPFPLCSKGHFYDARLVEYCGRLGMICEREDFFELWVMEDGEGKVWSKRKRVGDMDPPSAFFTSEIALTPGCYNLKCHNLTNGNESQFDFECVKVGDAGVFGFMSDFEPVMKNDAKFTGGYCYWKRLVYFFFVLQIVVFLFFFLFGCLLQNGPRTSDHLSFCSQFK